MNKKRRFLRQAASLIVAITLLLPVFMTTNVHAAEEKTLITIQQKLDLFLDKLGADEGKTAYFTVNQKACSSSRKAGHGCSNCSVSNVVATNWFKTLFGNVNPELFPSHDYSSSGRDNTGRSCFGFACFLQWYLFADNANENLVGKRVATIRFNKNEIMNTVKPGDVLRVNGHSVLVYSVEQNGIVVVDCNWNMGGQLNCIVQKHTIPYNASSCAGYTTYVNRVTKTSSMANGIAGSFDVNTNNIPQNNEKVYGTLDLSATKWSGYNVGLNKDMYADKAYTIRHGSKLEILGKYTNSKGSQVYHVYSYALNMNCYITAKYVKISEDALKDVKVYGTLDLSTTKWSGYNVGLNKDMYADKAYTIRHGSKLEILGKYTNSNGKQVYHAYSYDLDMECYISAKYVKTN